jgi:predicted outer membrane repeat protein
MKARQTMKRQRLVQAALTALLLFVSVGVARASEAVTDAVIGTGTKASCQTEAAANAFGAAVTAGGVISFNCGPDPVIITVNTSVVDKAVTINGRGMISLSGEDLRQLFLVQDTGNLTLNSLSLIDGNTGLSGGGAIWIAPQGRVTVNGSFFIGNQAESGGDGGAIYTSGTLTINDTTLGNNEAKTAGGDGGAIYINSGTVMIRRSYLINNQAQNGGAIRLVGGTLTFGQSAARP